MDTILFYNGGAKLTTEGSDSIEDLKKMEAEEFIKIYEYLKNEHEEEMAERYEEVMDVQYGIKLILEELQEIREVLGLEKKELPF